MQQRRRVQLMAEYGTDPLWEALDPAEGGYGAVSLDDFQLSEPLKRALRQWNADYAHKAAMQTSEVRAAWLQAGMMLKNRLQEELGEDYVVVFRES